MKIPVLSILALAALAFAGCSPAHGPSDYDQQQKPVTPTGGGQTGLGPVAGGEPVKQDDGLQQRDTRATKVAVNADGTWDPAAVLATVYFGFDKYHVAPVERSKIDSIADTAKNVRIIVAGYTDHFGTEQYNQGLSDKRAQSVKAYLVRLGAPEHAIEIQAFGRQYAKPSGTRVEVAEDRKAVIVNADYKK